MNSAPSSMKSAAIETSDEIRNSALCTALRAITVSSAAISAAIEKTQKKTDSQPERVIRLRIADCGLRMCERVEQRRRPVFQSAFRIPHSAIGWLSNLPLTYVKDDSCRGRRATEQAQARHQDAYIRRAVIRQVRHDEPERIVELLPLGIAVRDRACEVVLFEHATPARFRALPGSDERRAVRQLRYTRNNRHGLPFDDPLQPDQLCPDQMR